MPTLHALEQAEVSPCFDHILSEPNPAVDSPVELAGFRGKLDEIGLPSVLCILEMERRTGLLVLNCEPGREMAQLHLSEGRVFRAHLDSREEPRNAELVYGLIGGMRGTFDFRPSGVVLDDEIRCSSTRLLFEGARRTNGARPPLHTLGDGQDLPGLDDRVPLEVHPLEWGNSRTNEEGLRASLGQKKRGSTPLTSCRWISAKTAVAALAMAAFVMVVLTALLCSGDGAPDSLRNSPADASTVTD